MVSVEHYSALSNASSQYLSNEAFGLPHVEDVMNTVFGADRSGNEAESWEHYWNELNMYEEALHTGGNVNMPTVRVYRFQ